MMNEFKMSFVNKNEKQMFTKKTLQFDLNAINFSIKKMLTSR